MNLLLQESLKRQKSAASLISMELNELNDLNELNERFSVSPLQTGFTSV